MTHIVEPRYLIEQINSVLVARVLLRPTHALGFQTLEESLHCRVALNVTATAYAESDSKL